MQNLHGHRVTDPYENPTERRTGRTATKTLWGGVHKGCLGYSSQRTP